MENNERKVNLAGIFLILAIVIIMVMGCYIVTLLNTQNQQNKKVEELTMQLSKTQAETTELREKINGVTEALNGETTEEKFTESEDETKKLIKEKFECAVDIFLDPIDEMEIVLDINDSRVIKEEVKGQNYDWYYYPILNYEEVVNKYLTKNILKYFEEKAWYVITKNNKKYITEGGAGFISYDGIEEINNIKIFDNKITAIVKTKHNDMENKFLEYRESNFSIVKENDRWLIDEFDIDIIR